MYIQIDSPKRFLKSIRNLFVDIPPRNKILHIGSVSMTPTGFKICYAVVGDELAVNVELPDHLVKKLQDSDLGTFTPTFCAIAMAFAPYFFKLTDFSAISIDNFPIDVESGKFYSQFLQGGLGEFRYLQGLDPTRKVNVDAAQYCNPLATRIKTNDHVLMLNGGGKDSVVAGELLALSGQPFTWVTISSNHVRRTVIELSGNTKSIEINYRLDRVIESRKSYPWAHFPHTSVVLSLGLLAAQLIGARYICAGNEQSANHGNLVLRGFEINHQYTKSFEYERGFYNYVLRSVSPDLEVFSILRPFNDLQLAKIFSHFKKYHGSFISCNRGISRNEWCKNCPKCAFTALALYPFLQLEEIVAIFGEDVMQLPSIRRHILDLTSANKPWECVGTQDECKLALSLLIERYQGKDFNESPKLSDMKRAVSAFDSLQAKRELLEKTVDEHLIPVQLRTRLNLALVKLSEPLIV